MTGSAGLANVESFIQRWNASGGSERANYQLFMQELCDLLEVPKPQPQGQDARDHDYVFERRVTFRHGDGSETPGFIDLYRRGAFVCEAKKLKQAGHTKGFADALLRARSQAESYARALPVEEGRPPFLLVVDVGNCIELYAEFSRSGATYTPFPDPSSHRIPLSDLLRGEVRERLRQVWLAPLSLDPSRESARVTREIADRLAQLAKSLEASGHAAESVAQFLMRCLFTMFAEDVRLLPADAFRNLLTTHRERPDTAMRMLAQLWRDMDGGGFSPVLAEEVLRFNGKLFKQPDVLPLDRDQIGLLIDAAKADWKHVEPAIFGTLLERALSPQDRHKLGAHYTPRAYVERLVLPTVIEPLRQQWRDVQAAALTLASEDKTDDAVQALRQFHHQLCNLRVLDPACGSGNFLYVTLEHLKRLEGEVLNTLDDFGYRQTGLAIDGERADASAGETVDPHNLLGIELNPRAAAIAEVVLWIGYLQWHFRTRGNVRPPVPVIRDFRNIENRDAVLAYDRIDIARDANGEVRTRWDGRTMKVSPITGEAIPDDRARVPIEVYVNPRKAAWPTADFVVGNPPFIGAASMRQSLGDGYTEALRAAWPALPDSADFVMVWWHHAADLTRQHALKRFGFITTNSLKQTFNRRVLEAHLNPPAGAKSADSKRSVPIAAVTPANAGVHSVATQRACAQAVTPANAGVHASLLDSRVRGNDEEVRVARDSGDIDASPCGNDAPLCIVWAIPDHPWVDASNGAAVRIAMTVGSLD
ncbi:MAG: type IIL restriction-modification enzyme MmeI, partial [Lysobacteraceae bacterium]